MHATQEIDVWLLLRIQFEIKCSNGSLARQHVLSSSPSFYFFSFLKVIKKIVLETVLSKNAYIRTLVFCKEYQYNILIVIKISKDEYI